MTDFDTAGAAGTAFDAQLAALPARSRVHEVAKRFAVASRLLIEALGEGGVSVTSPSSSVDATAARTALTALRDSGRLVTAITAITPTAAAAPADSVDAVEAVVADAVAVADAQAPAEPALVEPAAAEAAPVAAEPVEPAPWAPLFAEPVATAAPARPARRRASRPAAPPTPVAEATVSTSGLSTPSVSTASVPTPTTTPFAPVELSTAPAAVDVTDASDDEQYADLPTRMRVHELAKRAGVSAKTLIALLTELGVTAKSANSVLAKAVAIDVLQALAGPADDAGTTASTDDSTDVSDNDDSEASDGDAGREDGRRSRRRRGRRGRNRTDDRGADDTDDDVAPGVASDDTADRDDTDGPDDGDGTAPVAGSDSDTDADDDTDTDADGDAADETDRADGGPSRGGRRRRRRGGRGGDRGGAETDGGEAAPTDGTTGAATEDDQDDEDDADGEQDGENTGSVSSRRRRRRRRGGSDDSGRADDPADTVVHVRDTREARSAESEVQGVRGSTRLEAKRQRRRDSLQTRRRPQILTEAEFLARRESVHRVMAVRQRGDLTQVAVLEDNVLVEHFVSRAGSASMIGNVHLGRVQNVLPSMEAAFVDIGKGRNAVLYAGEVNWEAAGLAGKSRRIETALSSGDTVLVQVSKDPVGHKGARLTTQISLPGRFLVYVPAGGATGISRKLPDTERKRLKAILDRIVPDDAGVIIRTAAEGVSEEELARDVERLKAQWEQIQAAAAKQTQGAQPKQLYSEPDTLIKVIRDLFNSDISELIIDGDDSEHGIWDSLSSYVDAVAPELAPRVHRYDGATDVFAAHRIDEQIAKALERKVFLPSGGSLVIDRTEAMTVVDVNTGKYTGSGGNLEETVTKNNLEAAEEVVRQLRLRDIGGIIVVDFIDMVLESNRELVLRRLTECLGRDRTRHQVAEVTSLGLVQMTRKKMGTGLVEAFSEPCAHCQGRGIVLRDVPVDPTAMEVAEAPADRNTGRRARGGRTREPIVEVEPVIPVVATPRRDPRGPKPPELVAGGTRPADEEPANELSSSLLAELNGRAGEPADPDTDTDNGASPVDPEVLAALLPGFDTVPADGVDDAGDDAGSDVDAATDELTADAESRDGAPRRRRRGGRGRSRREQRAADPADAEAGSEVETEDEGVSPDDAVLTEFDEPSTADTGADEVEADQLDLLPALEVAEVTDGAGSAGPGEVLDPADAMSDVAVMESSFAESDAPSGVVDLPVEDEPVEVEPAPAAPPRRRRSASRPAGPPQV